MTNKVLLGASLAVTLLVAACSQRPAEVPGGLGAQFGSPRDDYANVVTTDAARGRVYVAGAYTGPANTDRGDVLFFRRHNRDGSLAWKLSANVEAPGTRATAVGADTDAAGNVYFGWSTSAPTSDPAVRTDRAFISKYSASGRLLFRKELPNETPGGLAADAAGNVYMTLRNYGASGTSFSVRRYSSSGKLVWAKALRHSDFPDDLTQVAGLDVAADGSVYLAASYIPDRALLIKLRGGDGKLLDSSPVGGDFGQNVTATGNSVYVYSVLDSPFHFEPIVSRYRPDGSRVWERRGDFGGDETFDNLRYDAATGGISADTYGNVYLTGTFVTEGDGYDLDVLVRKYTPSGGVAYNRRFVDPAAASGLGVAVASGGELYAVGSTDGTVNGRDNGGRGAFLTRLDAQGRKVWER